jgi:hypothetical protein
MCNLTRKIFVATSASLALCGLCAAQANAQQIRPVAKTANSAGKESVVDLITRLGQVGEQLSRTKSPVLIAAYNLQQADIIGQILAQSKPEDRPSWIRQLADCLLAAASVSPERDHIALSRLNILQAELDRSQPGTSLTAYVTLQALEAQYMTDLNAKGVDLQKIQVEWCHRLDAFVQTYPQADATPRALHEMALTSEALDKHENARRCCNYLVEHFPADPMAADARRMLNWMDLDGNVLHLALPRLLSDDERFDSIFDVASLRGKLVVVYFWNSNTPNWREGFAALKKACERYHDKGVEVLCVNMDETPQSAREQLRDAEAPGTQVFQRKGVDGFAGKRLGLPEMPAMLLVGRDGRVVERVAGLGQLELHVGKHLEPESPLIRVSEPSK